MAKRAWYIHWLALLGYTVLSIAITWPLVLHFCTALPGEGTDSWQYLWNFWWFDQALFHGQRLYFTPAQYYPGTSLLFHTLSPLHSILGLPARLLGGYLAAYNFVVLLSTVLSGYGVYLLTKEVLRDRNKEGTDMWGVELASFLSGAIFALAPYRSVHLLGHLSLVATETLPFFALFCWRALRKPGWKPALGIALSWLAAALIDWYYPFYMGLLAAFFLAWTLGEALLRRRSWSQAGRTASSIVGGLLAAALLLSPLLLPMLREAGSAAYLAEPLEFSATYGADLLAFFLPSPLHPLWGHLFHRWTDGFAAGNTAEGIVYLGFVPLALAVLGLWRAWRAGKASTPPATAEPAAYWPWAVMAGLFGLLSLGPYLTVLNRRTPIPLPYWLFARLPIVRFTRVPSRYALLLHIGMAVLAGLAVASLWHRRITDHRADVASPPTPTRRGWLLTTLFLALLLLEYATMPYPLTPAEIPPFYQQLAEDTEHYALLEVPLQQPDTQWYYTDWMLHQTVHGKWSFRGYISRGDPLFPFEGAPLFRQFARLAPFGDIHYDDYRELAGPVLSHYRVGYIVLERGRLEEQGRLADAEELVQEVLGPTAPAFADETLVAYRVDWGPVTPFLRLGQGWHEVETQPQGPFRWIERDRAEVYVILPQAQEVTLTFQAVSFLQPRRLEIRLGDEMAAELEISAALEWYSVPLQLPAGETRLEWRAEGYDIPARVGVGEDPRELSIGISGLRLVY